jgi:hypothetical protein
VKISDLTYSLLIVQRGHTVWRKWIFCFKAGSAYGEAELVNLIVHPAAHYAPQDSVNYKTTTEPFPKNKKVICLITISEFAFTIPR